MFLIDYVQINYMQLIDGYMNYVCAIVGYLFELWIFRFLFIVKLAGGHYLVNVALRDTSACSILNITTGYYLSLI